MLEGTFVALVSVLGVALGAVGLFWATVALERLLEGRPTPRDRPTRDDDDLPRAA